MKNAAAFFTFAHERHSIYLKRAAGKLWPWTEDPILRKYRFTNVFRELDKTTVWFRENIREPLRNDPRVLAATVAFRWFNRIETGERIKDLLLDPWDTMRAAEALAGVRPVVTGAYIIKTPDGMGKLEGVLWCISNFLGTSVQNVLLSKEYPCRLETWWMTLRKAPYLGDFMAYEVVTDLRHTYLLENAQDIHTWANPGPGACRGYGRVTGEGVGRYDRNRERDREEVIKGMHFLLMLSGPKDGSLSANEYWSSEFPRWEMREVEHTLCEFDKYERVRLGEGRPRGVFRP